MNIKNNLTYILSFLLFLLMINFISYKYLMTSFLDIEKDNNNKSIHNVLNTFDEQLKNISVITKDYANWDQTYNFIKNINNDFLYENFRENSNTLENLDLDFIILTKKNHTVKFSSFIKEYSKDLAKKIQNKIILEFKDKKDFTTLYKYKINKDENKYFLISKARILNSDTSKSTDSFMYIAKIINLKFLSNIEKSFDKIEIINKKASSNTYIQSRYLKNINIETINEDDLSFNILSFHNINKEFIFSIVTQKKRKLAQKGRDTIFAYNLTISGFLVFIFILIYRHQIFLKNYNKRLERSVDRKTRHLKSTNQKLRILSQTDELTKINNRRNFFALGIRELKKSINQNLSFSILMLDIDNFKKINDTYGHAVGDKILIHLSQTISEILDTNHIFARLGGEEFAIAFINISEEESYKIAQNIRKTIADSLVEVDNISLKYTISIGLANKEDKTQIDDILNEADSLLYCAKNRGKNRIIRNRNEE